MKISWRLKGRVKLFVPCWRLSERRGKLRERTKVEKGRVAEATGRKKEEGMTGRKW